MRLNKFTLVALGLCLSTAIYSTNPTTTLSADTLVIKNTGQFYSKTKPQKGTSKAQVKKRFGEPMRTSAPVGNPPITRWRYDGFTVYFEHNHVIHAVDNNRSRQR